MTTPTIPAPARDADRLAREQLGLRGDVLAAWAPGRVNLIGEHTDYNGGFVLPIAIERCVALAGQMHPSDRDGVVRLYSAHHRQDARFTVAAPPTAMEPRGAPLWARYIAGVVGELRATGVEVPGFSAAVAGDVPLGGGLSSSAALIMATLTWLCAALNLTRDPLDLARLGQRAEARGAGVRVGILDHAAAVLGRPGMAILIDCRSFAWEPIPFALPEVGFLICETGVERSLASSGYNQRVAECEAAVAAFASALAADGDARAVTTLRDLTERDYDRLAGSVPEPARRRARHVLTENTRVLTAAAALRAGEAELFGRRLLQSHASLRDDYAVSVPELDAVVAIATRQPGALGARLVGAGFGGGALVVARAAALPAIAAALQRDYPAQTGRQPTIHRLTAAGGPGSAVLSAG